jgi:hypothetical protein
MALLSPKTTPPRQMARTCRKEKLLARTVRPKLFARKAIKKGAAKPERTFLGKEKYKESNKGQCSSVGPALSKGKLLPSGRKGFSAQLVIVSAVRVPGACSPISSIPALLHFQPPAASSRLRPPLPWPPSCSTPLLR